MRTPAPERKNFGLEQSEVKRRHLLPKALAVGICSGSIAAAFRISMRVAETWRGGIRHQWPGIPGLGIALAVGAAGGGLALWLVVRFAPETAGSGVPHIKAVVLGETQLRWKRVLSIKFLAGLLGIGSGLALGREGPTIQMGGATGLMVASALRIKAGEGERKALISAGAGAGLAAAFNAPLAGMVFVLEELHGNFTPIIFVSAFLAAVVADVVSRLLTGGAPVFALRGMAAPTYSILPAAALAGVVLGFLGTGFNRSIFWSLDQFKRLAHIPPFVKGALVGGLSGLAGWLVPGIAGSGAPIVEEALTGGAALGMIPLLMLLRFVLTVAGFGMGAAGGIFLPLMVLGALGGLAFGGLAHTVSPAWIPHPEVFAVLGMGGLFTAIVRAPLTGLILMIELTGVYDFMLPLLVTCFAAYGVAEALGVPPVYEELRLRAWPKPNDP
jgi:CIC family chloride channel protein